MDGWKPSIPDGQAFEIGTDKYTKVEKKGLRELGKVGFVLVAGGLGERLGYSGAKVRRTLLDAIGDVRSFFGGLILLILFNCHHRLVFLPRQPPVHRISSTTVNTSRRWSTR